MTTAQMNQVQAICAQVAAGEREDGRYRIDPASDPDVEIIVHGNGSFEIYSPWDGYTETWETRSAF